LMSPSKYEDLLRIYGFFMITLSVSGDWSARFFNIYFRLYLTQRVDLEN